MADMEMDPIEIKGSAHKVPNSPMGNQPGETVNDHTSRVISEALQSIKPRGMDPTAKMPKMKKKMVK